MTYGYWGYGFSYAQHIKAFTDSLYENQKCNLDSLGLLTKNISYSLMLIHKVGGIYYIWKYCVSNVFCFFVFLFSIKSYALINLVTCLRKLAHVMQIHKTCSFGKLLTYRC